MHTNTVKSAALYRNSVQQFRMLWSEGWEARDIRRYMQERCIPGASIAVFHSNEIVWASGYGLVEAGKDNKVTTDTLFQAASISKPVAALTALTMVQEGKLSLDEDVRRYLTSWQLPDNHGVKIRVTLRQLLSHTAGVTVPGFWGYTADLPLPSMLDIFTGEYPVNSEPILVDTLPGLRFRYSGGGYTLLQQMIEDVSGMPFWKAARERILDPAKMSHSTYRCPLPEDQRTDVAAGHRADGEVLERKWHNYPESAAAGLWTTPLDLAHLLLLLDQTLQGKNETLIPRRLLEEALSPHCQVPEIRPRGWMGLGFFLSGNEDDLYYGHGGSNEGYRCRFIVRKGKGQGAVIMTNSDVGHELVDTWMNMVAEEYDWTGYKKIVPSPLANMPGDLHRFTGEYRIEDHRDTICVLEESGGLFLEMQGNPALKMLATSDEVFFLDQLNSEIHFIFKDGNCTGLIIRQDQQDIPASKIERTSLQN